ncbi:MAG TPA: hypothetical protein VHC69_30975 [Polyangiaceae bacterium]|nr:hypothetical protein [Polyangiaceae bacterium]
MPTQTTMICTNNPTKSGSQVVMQADQTVLSSALATCTAVVATSPPVGTYTTISGPQNDTASVNLDQSTFDSLCSELSAGSVELTIIHTGSSISEFDFQAYEGLARAGSSLRENVTAIYTRVEDLAAELAKVRGAVEELLKRSGRAA